MATEETNDSPPNFRNLTFMPPEESRANYLKNIDARPTLEELMKKTDCTVSEIAQAFEREYYFATLKDTDELRIYRESGVYTADAETVIKGDLQTYFPTINSHTVREVLTKIRQRHYVDRNIFDHDPDWLHVDNGWINTSTLEWKDHSPDFYSLYKLPARYDPKATCPIFLKFLRETIEPEHFAIIVKLLGYLLLLSAKYQVAFMLVGEGSNGKSTFIKIVVSLLGPQNCSSASLQELNDKFIPAKLDGMMANLCADLKTDKISDSGNFKMLVSGDRMLVQNKNKDPYYFENHAKLVFSANQIPETADKSYAYFRRWIIIPFNRTFEGADDDKNLVEKLTTAEERSGILNLALKGLSKLKADNGFKEMNIEDIRNQYQMGASRIKSFLEENYVIEAGNESLGVEASRLKESYRSYCRKKGTSYIDERKFGEELKSLGIIHKQKRIARDRKPYYYFGIALKDESLKVLDKPLTPRESIENNSIGGEGAQLPKTLGQPEHPENPRRGI